MNTSPLIYPNVQLGENCQIEPFCIIGKPPRGAQAGDRPLLIGAGAVIRSGTVIYAGSTIGDNFQSGHGVLIREDNTIGDAVSIGTNSTIEFGNVIGSRTRIHSGCFLERATLAEDVFIGPNVVFTDDPHPICPRYQDCKRAATIGRWSRIGANSTLLPGIQIGQNCLIGAGSVVTGDIPAGMVAAGNPARLKKPLTELTCEAGFYERPYDWLKI